MPNDVDRASRPWTMTFRVTGAPCCPGCCVELAGVVITFHEGWAWCPVCSNLALHAQVHLRFVLHHDVMRRCSVISHGLRFYLPHRVDGRLLNAIDEYECLINEPEPDLPAIAAWPGFNLVQLPQSVRDRDQEKEPIYSRPVRVPFGYEIAGVADDGRVVLLEIAVADPATDKSAAHHTNSDGNRE